MISLKLSDFRISEVAKIISKYPIQSTILSEKIVFNGEVPEKCINELLELGLTIESISTSEKSDHSAAKIYQYSDMSPSSISSKNGEQNRLSHAEIITRSQTHSTQITQNSDVYKVIYPTPKYGELYWVDFGSPFGYEEAYIRPALVVKSGGVFKSITTVIPMSSQVENYTDSSFTPIFTLTEENMENYIPNRLSPDKFSCLLVEQIRAVDNSRLRGYIGSLEPTFLNKLMDNVRNFFEQKEAVSKACS